jgi:hypothetical protein
MYGTFVKVCTAGGYKGIRWTTHPMSTGLLRNVRLQLVQALAYIDAQLQSEEGRSSEL